MPQLQLDLFDECQGCNVSTAIYDYQANQVYAYCEKEKKYRYLDKECKDKIIERVES